MHKLTGRLPGPFQGVWDGFQKNVDDASDDVLSGMKKFGDSLNDNIKATGGQIKDSWGLVRQGVDGGIDNGRSVAAHMNPLHGEAHLTLGGPELNSDNNGREPWRQQPWGPQGQGGFGDPRFGGPGGDHRWGPGGRWAPEHQGQWGQGQQGQWGQGSQGQWGQGPQGQWSQPQGQWGQQQGGRGQFEMPQTNWPSQNPWGRDQNQWNNQGMPSRGADVRGQDFSFGVGG